MRAVLLILGGISVCSLPLLAQNVADPNASACADSKVLPHLELCRIDNCEKKDSDHRDIPVREDERGEPVISPVEGSSNSYMYECQEGTKPGDIVQQAAAALRASGYAVPYHFADREGTVTAHKDDQWVLVEAASRFYTLTELTAEPELETASDAAAMAEVLERYGHVPLYGVHFLTGSAGIAPESVIALREVAAMMQDDPDMRLYVEGHTDNVGDPQANLILAGKRATAVVNWLVLRGIKRSRMEVKPIGDARPVASNDTETGRAKNRRIELSKISAQ